MWLKQRCTELHLNIDTFVSQMCAHQINVDRATVTAWINGTQVIPIEDIAFRRVLSRVLRLSGIELVNISGYGEAVNFAPPSRRYSSEAELAAQLVDKLNHERRALAIRLLRTLLQP